MNDVKKRVISRPQSIEGPESTASGIAGAVIFLLAFALSALVLAALAMAAPLVLVLSALAGLIAGKKSQSSWRPAGA